MKFSKIKSNVITFVCLWSMCFANTVCGQIYDPFLKLAPIELTKPIEYKIEPATRDVTARYTDSHYSKEFLEWWYSK